MLAHRVVRLIILAYSSAVVGATACPSPPVVTSDGAICLAKLRMDSGATRTYKLEYQAEEHKDYWFVWYGPEESNVRGGGGKLRIDKASGRIVVVELYR